MEAGNSSMYKEDNVEGNNLLLEKWEMNTWIHFGNESVPFMQGPGLCWMVACSEQAKCLGTLCTRHRLCTHQCSLLWEALGHDSNPILRQIRCTLAETPRRAQLRCTWPVDSVQCWHGIFAGICSVLWRSSRESL